MKINGIFEKINGRLFAAHFDNSDVDELDKAFDSWREVSLVYDFFTTYRSDLMKLDPTMKVKTVPYLIVKESKVMFDILIDASINGRLSGLFKPLDNREERHLRYDFQMFKAKGPSRKSMLRLYAVKFMDAYVISGGAIKVTEKMSRPHLKTELYKLELLQRYLQADGIEGSFVYLDIDL
ncbi:MAG: hypothetical protein WDO14_07105 [Bacteroidota bacterium]